MSNLILNLIKLVAIVTIHDIVGIIFYSWVIAVREHPTLSDTNRTIFRWVGVGGLSLTLMSLVTNLIHWFINL